MYSYTKYRLHIFQVICTQCPCIHNASVENKCKHSHSLYYFIHNTVFHSHFFCLFTFFHFSYSLTHLRFVRNYITPCFVCWFFDIIVLHTYLFENGTVQNMRQYQLTFRITFLWISISDSPIDTWLLINYYEYQLSTIIAIISDYNSTEMNEWANE